jgi:TPR repeat protein
MMMGLLKDIENMMHLGVLGEEFGPDSLLSDEEKQEAEAREQALFNNDLPPRPDCDICFNELPVASNQKTYKICCGKILCDGCIEEIRDKDDRKEKVGDLCPFCRTVATTSNTVELVKKRMEVNDPESFACMAHILMEGTYGQKRDEEKALSLMEKGAELGSLGAMAGLGNAYVNGAFGLQKDIRKGKRYLEDAAIKGNVEARYTLACMDNTKETVSRGVKHFIIGARSGHKPSLDAVKKAFNMGYATKVEYEDTLRAYHESQNATKTDERERALKFNTRADDNELFKDPLWPDCPICSLPLPPEPRGSTYLACCGTKICGGCTYDMDMKTGGQIRGCGVCSMPPENSLEEHLERLNTRIDKYNDPLAYNFLGLYYNSGKLGLPKDISKAHALWEKGGEMGSHEALGNLAAVYDDGDGAKYDRKKARYYYELAAMKGDVVSRHNLGVLERLEGNNARAVKHWMISAAQGGEKSLETIQQEVKKGNATKDEYEKALRSYQIAVKRTKSKSREKATNLREKGLGSSTPIDSLPGAGDAECIVS